MDAGVRHVFAPQEFAQGSSRTPQFHGTGGNAVFGQHGQDFLFFSRAVHLFHWARVQIFPHGVPVSFHQALGQVYLAYHGGQHVAVFQVEIVIGAVQICRHDGDVVGTVLQVEAFAHFQPCYFGNGIGFVGVFQRGGEQGVFLHGLGGFARVDAGAPQEEELGYAMPEAFPDDVLLNLEIAEDEVRPVAGVGDDAAHKRRCQKDVFRLFPVKKFPDGRRVFQIQFFVRPANQVGIAFVFQGFPDGGTDEAAVSGHKDSAVFFHLRNEREFLRISCRGAP